MGRDVVAGFTGGLELGSEGASFDEGAVLANSREERGAANFLPEVKASLVPI